MNAKFALSMGILLAVAWVLSTAPAALAQDDHESLEWGWYLYCAGRATEATAIAAELLEEDPSRLEAHSLYHHAWWSAGDRWGLLAQYRSWAESDPDNETARVALAMLVGLLRTYVDEPKTEIRQLLDPLPSAPEARFWALLTLRGLVDEGEGDEARDAAVRAMIAAAQESGRPRLQRRATLMRLSVDGGDRELAGEVMEAVGQQPSMIEHLGYALWPDKPKGSHAGALRTFARRYARQALDGDDPVPVLWSEHIGVRAGDEDASQKARIRLGELDPDGNNWSYGPLDRAIYDSTQRFNPDVGLDDLDQLEGQIPVSGPLRIKLEEARANLLSRLDRDAEAHAAYKAAMTAGADRPGSAIKFAGSARKTGQNREIALDYLDEALLGLEFSDYSRDADMASLGLAGWTEYNHRLMACVLHAMALLLTDLDRPDEATDTLIRACALADRATDHEALAEAYTAQGRDDAAFEHLLRAAVLRLERSPDAFEEDGLPEDLSATWESRPYWHHDGLEGLLADQVTALEKEGRKPPRKPRPRLPVGPDHPLMGQLFPDLAYQLGKREQHLSDHEGVLLVQLWNPG